jgi:hypothetical protein
LERQNRDLKAELVELETAQRSKNKATIATLKSKSNNLEVEQWASYLKVCVIAAAAVGGWDHAVL